MLEKQSISITIYSKRATTKDTTIPLRQNALENSKPTASLQLFVLSTNKENQSFYEYSIKENVSTRLGPAAPAQA